MKEKGDPCVMVGYSTQSKGYRVYNKRTRLIAESIHIKFDEIKDMMSDHNSSDLAPQRQEISIEDVSSGLITQGHKASDYDNSDPVPPRQNVVPSAEKTDSSQQGLEFLFSPLLEEYYNPTNGLAEENNNDQAPNASFQEDEFINPFCTRVQEIGESSSRNIDNTDVHSFQPQSHDYRWTRDHPLEQVHGNPTMPVQKRQLATDPEMCMFALTVSIDNKRTRLIVESIHIKFNEIKEMMSDHNSSDFAPQRQEIQNVVPTAEKTYSSQQGLEFLFSPLLEEYYNPTYGHAEDNNNDQAPDASFQEAEFINPFCTRVQEIDPEMCMFALTVSIVEPKNIKEAMADSAWIEAMQDELHQFDRLKV
ncbi:integrase, catalytic region, zinc finger, CCHC-type containing protein [Tanacetum coccineum]